MVSQKVFNDRNTLTEKAKLWFQASAVYRLQNSRFFFLKISREIGKAWRNSLTRASRASLTRVGRVRREKKKF